MTIRKISYLFLAVAVLLTVTACSNYARHYSEPVDIPAGYAYDQVRGNPGATRRGPATRTVIPAQPHRPPGSGPASSAPGRVTPHSSSHPRGQVIQVPDYHTRIYEPKPQAIQPIPPEPFLQADTIQVNPPSHSPVPAVGSSAAIPRPSHTGQELASHKTEFDAKDQNRATNITRASASINGKTVRPGETFSYNETVGPTIEERGYKEGVIFVEGEKKEGFGGGVCQVSTTLSIAADEAGLTILERHDHSRPVTYAKEGEEAATSYGGLDFKFKNELGYPVVIYSSVEDGSVMVSIIKTQ